MYYRFRSLESREISERNWPADPQNSSGRADGNAELRHFDSQRRNHQLCIMDTRVFTVVFGLKVVFVLLAP